MAPEQRPPPLEVPQAPEEASLPPHARPKVGASPSRRARVGTAHGRAGVRSAPPKPPKGEEVIVEVERRVLSYWLQTFFVVILTTAFVVLGFTPIKGLDTRLQAAAVLGAGLLLLAFGDLAFHRWKDLYAKGILFGGWKVIYTALWALHYHFGYLGQNSFFALVATTLVVHQLSAHHYRSEILRISVSLIAGMFLITLRAELLGPLPTGLAIGAFGCLLLLQAVVLRSGTLALVSTAIIGGMFALLGTWPGGQISGTEIKPFIGDSALLGVVVFLVGAIVLLRPFLGSRWQLLPEVWPGIKTTAVWHLSTLLLFVALIALSPVGAAHADRALFLAALIILGSLGVYLRARNASLPVVLLGPLAGIAIAVGGTAAGVAPMQVAAATAGAALLALVGAYRILDDLLVLTLLLGALLVVGVLPALVVWGLVAVELQSIAVPLAGLALVLSGLLVVASVDRKMPEAAVLGAVGAMLLGVEQLHLGLRPSVAPLIAAAALMGLTAAAFPSTPLKALRRLEGVTNFQVQLVRNPFLRPFRLVALAVLVQMLMVGLLIHNIGADVFVSAALVLVPLILLAAAARSNGMRQGRLLLPLLALVGGAAAIWLGGAALPILVPLIVLVVMVLAVGPHASDQYAVILLLALVGVAGAMGRFVEDPHTIPIPSSYQLWGTFGAVLVVALALLPRYVDPIVPAASVVIVVATLTALALDLTLGAMVLVLSLCALYLYFARPGAKGVRHRDAFLAGLGAVSIAALTLLGFAGLAGWLLWGLLLVVAGPVVLGIHWTRGSFSSRGVTVHELILWAGAAALQVAGIAWYWSMVVSLGAIVVLSAVLLRASARGPEGTLSPQQRWALLLLPAAVLATGRAGTLFWGIPDRPYFSPLAEGMVLLIALLAVQWRRPLTETGSGAAVPSLVLLAVLVLASSPQMGIGWVAVPTAFLALAMMRRDALGSAASAILLVVTSYLWINLIGQWAYAPLAVLALILVLAMVAILNEGFYLGEPATFSIGFPAALGILLALWALGSGALTTFVWIGMGTLLTMAGLGLSKRYLWYPGVLYLVLAAGKAFASDWWSLGVAVLVEELLALGGAGLLLSYWIRSSGEVRAAHIA